MEFFKPGTLFDFMRHRRMYGAVSAVLVVLSLISIVYPGPNYGTDFLGGTEIQVSFRGDVSDEELRSALSEAGYDGVDVVAVVERPNEYMIRTGDFSAVSPAQLQEIDGAVRAAVAALEGDVAVLEGEEGLSVPEGGDKVQLHLSGEVDPSVIEAALEGAGVSVVRVTPFGATSEHMYEAQLAGIADEMIAALEEALGERGPNQPERIERVGPRAGAQLRIAALKSFLYSIAFIMLYVAFRFDLRYAPGGILALSHDAIITLGVLNLLQREFNLAIVAALLTIVGYSINDTIVVYDRIRENMGRYRDKSLYDVINISTSQTLSRSIMTSATTLLSVTAFFIWGTAAVRDISFALFIGILIGTYSSIFIAAPFTEWMDTRFFSRAKARGKQARATQRKKA